MQLRVKSLILTVLFASCPLSAQTEEFIKLCSAPMLEEPMLLSINSLFKTLRISGVRNANRCKVVGDILAAEREIYFDTHEMLTLEPLRFFPNIQAITIEGSPDLDYETLKFVPHLERLRLSADELPDFQSLTYLEKLKDLNIYTPNHTETNFPPNVLKNLEYLSLAGLMPIDWNSLAIATKIKSAAFYFGNDSSTQIGGDWLQYLTQLRSFEVINADLSAENQASLSLLTNLTSLNLYNSNLANSEFLKSLTKLRNLTLSRVGLDTLPEMSHLKNLAYLNLYGNNLTSLEPIRDLLTIESLSFERNKISNIEALSGLTSLRKLFMSENRVDRIAPIANLLNLTYVNITDNCISDLPILRRLQTPHRNRRDEIIALTVNGADKQTDVCEQL